MLKIVNNPAADDGLARHLSNTANCIVISIDYSKSPQSKFPTAYEDIIAQTLAIITDSDLPIDPSRVIFCGHSAGGNLLFATAQDARLRGKVLGIVGIYPVLDLAGDGEAKMATRPDAEVPDFIGESYGDVSRLYLEPDYPPALLRDVRVSPAFVAERESLPPRVLLIGAEHDMFCREDEVMAGKLVDLAGHGGRKVERENGWKAESVEWYKVMGQPHAFDAFPAKAPVTEASRLAAVEEMFAAVAEWVVEVIKNGAEN